MSNFVSILLFLTSINSLDAGVLPQTICPPAEALSPCTCSESQKAVRCVDIRGRFDIKEVFDNASTFVADDAVFNSLEFRGISAMLEIPDGAITSFKFLAIDISSNPNLDYISPLAFNATYKVTTNLDMWLNNLGNDAPNERDVFDFINNFEVLESVWLPNNRISSIPDNAFGPIPTLREIYLGSNSISYIGADAFARLLALNRLWLQSNRLPSLGISSEAFANISPTARVDATYNSMQYLSQAGFKTLLDSAADVEVGGRRCGSNGCSYERLDCDMRADWICEDVDKYRGKLTGFLCSGGVFTDVFEYCTARL